MGPRNGRAPLRGRDRSSMGVKVTAKSKDPVTTACSTLMLR
jgi:hypothetical protein